MIPIHKGAAPPGLVLAGEQHVTELCAAYDADPDVYRSGTRKLIIRESIYKAEEVKAELNARHYGKCCYCETCIQKPYAHCHVEHWRPKSSCRQDSNAAIVRPGYYWLAYSWDNLLLSCAFCNSINKRDLFPLEDPSARALHHGMSVEDETPSILKPDSDEDPRDHITFHMEVPVALTPLGRKTIEVLGLDSPAHELRLRHLREIDQAREMSVNLMTVVHPTAQNYAQRLRQFVEDAIRPEKPYSAMVAAFLHANPLPDPPPEL